MERLANSRLGFFFSTFFQWHILFQGRWFTGKFLQNLFKTCYPGTRTVQVKP